MLLNTAKTGFYEFTLCQSNGLGNELVASLPSDLLGDLNNIHVFENNAQQWQILHEGQNNSGDVPLVTGRYGIEGRLFKLLRDYYKSDQYFLKTSRGGSGLAIGSSASSGSLDWDPTLVGQMWTRSLNSRIAALSSLNPNVRFRARISLQGEQDTTSSTYADAYETNQIAFLAALGGTSQIPFIDFSLSSSQTALDTTNRNKVNTAKYNTSSIIYTAATGVFTTKIGGNSQPNKVYILQNEACGSDNIHYNATAYDNLAQYAFEVIKYLNNKTS